MGARPLWGRPIHLSQSAIKVKDDAFNLAPGNQAWDADSSLGRAQRFKGFKIKDFAIDVRKNRPCARHNWHRQQDTKKTKNKRAGDDAYKGYRRMETYLAPNKA